MEHVFDIPQRSNHASAAKGTTVRPETCLLDDYMKYSLSDLTRCVSRAGMRRPTSMQSSIKPQWKSQTQRQYVADNQNKPTGSGQKHRQQNDQTMDQTRDLTTMSSIRSPVDEAKPWIELNEVETRLKRLLLDVAQYIDSSRPPREPSSRDVAADAVSSSTVLRFTGGWVRDKLLGVESHDIDVSINNMTGLQFGLKMKTYLDIAGNTDKYGIKDGASRPSTVDDHTTPKISLDSDEIKVLGGLHKIEANPEKSKHLETVTTKVFGLDIDLVNLRTETYSETSRNPQMAFGTPEEDSVRRDATVNALFYNLNTSSVEDFTGLGLCDMRSKIIRTPLEPRQTFMDDPLRILRLIRFASRLGYSIEPTTEKAMDDQAIRIAFAAKISRERVGTEFDKMLRGAWTYFLRMDVHAKQSFQVNLHIRHSNISIA